MYRIFISHASAEFGAAKARKDWLVQQDPPTANDILLDADMVRLGPHWIDELNQGMKTSDAVVCATSNSWVGCPECIAGFRMAEYLNKRVLCARAESSSADEMGKAWQRADCSEMVNQQRLPSMTTGLCKTPAAPAAACHNQQTQSRTRART